MKPFPVLMLAALLAGCTTADGIEPIPGSLIYGGQRSERLTRAPVGSPSITGFGTGSGRNGERPI